MSQIRKRTAILLVFALVVSSFVGFVGVGTASAAGDQLQRIAGADRFETAAKIAEAKYPSGSNTVIVARSDDFADGLAASVLAGALNAPVLLTKSNDLPQATADVIKKLGAKKVIVLGSEKAISKNVEDALKNAAGEVERIGGADRVETAVKIAQKAKSSAEVAFIVNGWTYADAMTAGAAAFAKGYPVLAVKANELPAAVKDALKALNVKQVVIVGGESVVSAKVAQDIAAAGVQVSRIAGSDRVETSVEFAKSQFANASGYSIVNGWNLADAVGGAVFANPILYTYTPERSNNLPASVNALLVESLQKNGNTKIAVLGGSVAVSDATYKQLEQVVEENAIFAVSSVTVLNAKQIQVVFSKQVDPNNLGSYDLAGVAIPAASLDLQKDGRTLIINIPAANVPPKGADRVLTISNVKQKDDATKVINSYAISLRFNDSTAPSIISVTSVTSGVAAGTVKVKFSEPVATVSGFQIDGTNVTGTPNADFTEYTISNVLLDPTKTHTLSVADVADFVPAPDTNVANLLTKTFNVVTDNVAPTVSISSKTDRILYLTFSKPMNSSTVNNSNITVRDAGGGLISATIGPDFNAADTTATSATKYIVSLPKGLYATQNTHTFSVSFNNQVLDTVGNAIVAHTQQITVSKDTTAPVITSLGYETNTAGKVTAVVLNLSKGSEQVAAGSSIAGIKVVNPNGLDVSSSFFAGATKTDPIAEGDTKIKITLGSPTAYSGIYTFYFPAGFVTDFSSTGNKSAATVLTINFTGAEPTFKLNQSDITPAVMNADGSQSFKVVFRSPVKGGKVVGSATDVDNYRINNAVLPAGTVITLNSVSETVGGTAYGPQQVATITLPKGSISQDNTYAPFTVNNVQTTSGITITPFSGYVSVLDNVAPVLQSAKIIDKNTIILTYSEKMNQGITGNVESELIVKNGTTTYPDEITAAPVVGNPNQVMLTFETDLDLTKSVTITTKAGVVLKDASTTGNGQAADTTVTATK
ncbi:MAG: hypothetical protein BAA01_03250 [Bacillus thermozeamaize]|uniref:SbsA Ig-like domain-containing protein n=1 Tax=Bacillus thermozeamaize TaxID=230954 RepID=A0A1Y3PMS3_9BACI|nr:MAG: hypothetical protein BAA01_03250 [Bacillus thermozeamaize]